MQQKWVKVTAIILALLMACAGWALAFTPLYLNKSTPRRCGTLPGGEAF